MGSELARPSAATRRQGVLAGPKAWSHSLSPGTRSCPYVAIVGATARRPAPGSRLHSAVATQGHCVVATQGHCVVAAQGHSVIAAEGHWQPAPFVSVRQKNIMFLGKNDPKIQNVSKSVAARRPPAQLCALPHRDTVWLSHRDIAWLPHKGIV